MGVAGIAVLPGVVVEVLGAGVPTEATWMGCGGTGSTVLPGVCEGVLEGGGEEVLRLHMKVSQTKISTGFKSALMRTR